MFGLDCCENILAGVRLNLPSAGGRLGFDLEVEHAGGVGVGFGNDSEQGGVDDSVRECGVVIFDLLDSCVNKIDLAVE
jgi:hypothetical protein